MFQGRQRWRPPPRQGMSSLQESATLSKIEVLADLEPVVRDLMDAHESKRALWLPSDLLNGKRDTDPDQHLAALRTRARGISAPARVALALNLLTEEGLPHFHRLLAAYLGENAFWSRWTNLWTAEEDRHGAVLHDYTRDARVFDPGVRSEERRVGEGWRARGRSAL